MRRAIRVLFLVCCGIVGAWVGYWIGHAAGWSQNAEWPRKIGGGDWAILLSIGVSVLFVLIAGLVVFLLPQRAVRGVLAGGASAQATVVSVKETGGQAAGLKNTRRQVTCELDVCPAGGSSYRARVTQFVTREVQNALQPGATVAVRYDPAKPSRVAIEGPIAPAAG